MSLSRNIYLYFLIIFSTIACFPQHNAKAEISQKEMENTYKQLEVFSNVLSILQEHYVAEIDSQEIINGAINGMLLSLDPHSAYMTPESFRMLQEETRGIFPGIGIEITIIDSLLTIVSPIEGTPAAKAGLKAKDIIVKINDEPTKNMSIIQAVGKLRGPKGSEVNLTIKREIWEEPRVITITRDLIPLQSVKMFPLESGYVYTRITNFQNHTTRDYTTALSKITNKQQIKGLILDLRDNPGGLLNEAVSIADLFLEKGLIVYTRGRLEEQDMIYEARDSGDNDFYPLVVLLNEGSASASEIVAGAIQDHGRGILVGTRTFGKGSVQTIVPLPDGAGLRLTTAYYYTPKGRSIQVSGITPDVLVPQTPHPINSKDKPSSPPSVKREGDLLHHLLNTQTDTKERTDAEQPDQMEELFQKDNQLRMAFNILKSIDLYSDYLKTEESKTQQSEH